MIRSQNCGRGSLAGPRGGLFFRGFFFAFVNERLLRPRSSAGHQLPSTNPHAQRGAASRVVIVRWHLGHVHGFAGTQDQGVTRSSAVSASFPTPATVVRATLP